ncbi:MAG: hypothetical protein ABSG73_13150 [Candidatus Aminicenantales bacterium]|jgi:hypothetical protein
MEFLKIAKTSGERISLNLDRLAYATIFAKSVNFHFDSGLKISILEGEIEAGEFKKLVMALGFA